MSNKLIKLVVSDMDGTILNQHKKISDFTINIINQFIEHDIMFAFGTGRNLASLRPFVNLFKQELKQPIISLNGGLIIDHNGNIIEEKPFNTKDLITLIDILSRYNLYIGVQDIEYAYDYTNSKEQRRKWLQTIFPTLVNTDIEQTEQFRLTKFVEFNKQFLSSKSFYKVIVGNLDELDLDSIVKEINITTNCSISSSGKNNLEINPPNVTKGNAINKLASHYNLDLNQVLAIGDNLNDLSMLKTAGTFYAMKNSHPIILEHTKYITSSNQQDGVAKAIIDATKIPFKF